ncbi:MAG: hypothetical protein V1834_01370 [Candidatus Micrarchaeota archaeon]
MKTTIAVLLALFLLSGCISEGQLASPTPTEIPSPTQEAVASPEPSSAPSPVPSPTSSTAPSPVPSPEPSPVPTNTAACVIGVSDEDVEGPLVSTIAVAFTYRPDSVTQALIKCGNGVEATVEISQTDKAFKDCSYGTGSQNKIYTVTASAGTASCSYGLLVLGSATPVLSAIVNSSITESTVLITWTTNIDANATVYYGITTSYGSSNGNAAYTTGHSVQLSSLPSNTTHHFKVSSCTDTGLCSESSDFELKTLANVTPTYSFTLIPPTNITTIVANSSQTMAFTINNTGNQALSAFTCNTNNATWAVVLSGCPASLPNGSASTLTINFTTANFSAGIYTAYIYVNETQAENQQAQASITVP